MLSISQRPLATAHHHVSVRQVEVDVAHRGAQLITYADGEGRGAVAKQVIHFLNDEKRRAGLKGVIAGGNRNFGETFGLSGDIIAEKCNVPMLFKFELAGTDKDITTVRNGLENFWSQEC